MFRGSVDQLWRYPVKSMAGERVDGIRVDDRGAGGDRAHAVLFEHKGRIRPLTAREAPRLLAWRAGYPSAPGAALDPADPPLARVLSPAGEAYGWDDPALAPALAADLGRDVRLARDPGGMQDLGRTVLVTFAATLRALDAELPRPVDLRRFRTNVHLELDAPAWAEAAWEGGRIELAGGVVLELLHPCVRCAIPTRDPGTQEKWAGLLRHLAAEHATLFGINARIAAGGRIAAGEPAAVHPPR